MKKLVLLISCLVWVSLFSAKQIVIDLDSMQETSKEVSLEPSIAIEEIGDTIQLSFTMRYLAYEVDEDGFTQFNIPGFTVNSVSGEYLCPIKSLKFPISTGNNFEISETVKSSFNLPAKLNVVPEPQIDSEIGNLNVSRNEMKSEIIKTSHPWMPETIASASAIQYYRGYGFIPIQLSPIKYNEEEKSAKINYKFSIKIFPNAGVESPLKAITKDIRKLAISQDDKFFDEFLVKTESFASRMNTLKTIISGDIEVNPTKYGYLILSTRHHSKAATELAKWKRLLGYDVKIVTTKQSWTVSDIKSRITAYKNENPNFYYLLLIGDETQVPGISYDHPYRYSDFYLSDFPYACLDGDDDLTPDVYYGRIPATDSNESINAVNKIIAYEKTPPTDDKFYKSAFHASEFQETTNDPDVKLLPGEEGRMFVYTSEEAAIAMQNNCNFDIARIYRAYDFVSPKLWSTTYVGDNKYIPQYLLKPDFQWNGSADDIISSINSGVSYGLYRGHGDVTGWSTRINITSSDLTRLNNKNKYPVIFSITCLAGAYNQDRQCFCKQLLTQDLSGASGVIASTEVSYSIKNDLLTGLLMRAIWPQSNLVIYPKQIQSNSNQFGLAVDNADKTLGSTNYQLGKALNYATNSLAPFFSMYDHIALTTRRLFHCFGDPSMEVRTEAPQVIRDVIIKKSSDGFAITGNASDYKYGAFITVVDTLYNDIVAHQELRPCNITTLYPNRCKICISGRNLRPLVVNGKDGYDPRINPNFRSPGEGNSIFLDIESGIYYEKPYDYNEFNNRKSFYEDENGDIIYEIKEAEIKSDKWDREYWHLPNSRLYSNFEVPAIPKVTLLIDKHSDIDVKNIHIADFEFKDFNNVYCGWTGEPVPPEYDIVFNPNAPARYKGFWPEKPIVEVSENGNNTIKLEFTPILYSDEDRTMRVLHRIKFKRSAPEAGIELYKEESGEIEYFTIDGLPVNEPQGGGIYIRRQGNKFEKVRF